MLCIDYQITGGREVFIPHCERGGDKYSRLQQQMAITRLQSIQDTVFPQLWSSMEVEFCPNNQCKVKKILEDSLDSIPSPSHSVKIQIMGGKDGLRCKCKTLLGIVNKVFVQQSLLTMSSNVWPKNKNKKFKCSQLLEGDGIESRLPFKFFSALHQILIHRKVQRFPIQKL